MQWFRLYAEMIDDPKVGTLSDAEFRTWIELLCVTCLENIDGDTGLTVDELSWKLRRNVTETLQKLLHRNLVTFIDWENGRETVAITHWNKRQFKSDHVSERVRKYREKQRISECNVTETLQKRYCNGADTDTDTDTEKKEPSTPLPPTPKKKAPVKIPKPPSQDEVVEYFESHGYSADAAIKAYQYYDAGQWKDSKGNPVRSWKQKMIAVWFKDENKDRPQSGSVFQNLTGRDRQNAAVMDEFLRRKEREAASGL